MKSEINENGTVLIQCPTCLGSGKRWFVKSFGYDIPTTKYKMYECDHCNGSGYLERDWVSAIYEEPIGNIVNPVMKPRRLSANWTLEVEQDIQAIYSEKLANEMANQIDREILEMIVGGSNADTSS